MSTCPTCALDPEDVYHWEYVDGPYTFHWDCWADVITVHRDTGDVTIPVPDKLHDPETDFTDFVAACEDWMDTQ